MFGVAQVEGHPFAEPKSRSGGYPSESLVALQSKKYILTEQGTVDGSTATNQASGKDRDIIAPPGMNLSLMLDLRVD